MGAARYSNAAPVATSRIMDNLDTVVAEAMTAIAGAETLVALEAVRVSYLGKKGVLTALLQGLGALAPERRPELGARRARQVRPV